MLDILLHFEIGEP